MVRAGNVDSGASVGVEGSVASGSGDVVGALLVGGVAGGVVRISQVAGLMISLDHQVALFNRDSNGSARLLFLLVISASATASESKSDVSVVVVAAASPVGPEVVAAIALEIVLKSRWGKVKLTLSQAMVSTVVTSSSLQRPEPTEPPIQYLEERINDLCEVEVILPSSGFSSKAAGDRASSPVRPDAVVRAWLLIASGRLNLGLASACVVSSSGDSATAAADWASRPGRPEKEVKNCSYSSLISLTRIKGKTTHH